MSVRLNPGVALRASALALVTAFASPGYGQTLLQVYRDALTNDPTFAAARAGYQASTEAVPQARAGLLPLVGASANVTRQKQEIDFGSGLTSDTNRTARGYAVQLSQPIFRWQNWESYEQAKLSVVAAEANFVQAQQDLILRVTQAYFDVLTAEDSLTFVRAQKVAISEALASAKRNFEVGTSTIVDQNDAQARYDLAVAQEIAAENDLQVRRTALEQIVGKATGQLAALKPKVELPAPTPSTITSWVTAAESGNTGVRAAQANAEIAQREISRRRAGHYPTVDLVGTYSDTRNPATVNANSIKTSSVGVQVSVPLYAGGGTQSSVRQAVSQDEQARQNLEAARRVATQTARQTFLGVTNGLAQVKALEAAEVSSQTSLEANQLGYKVGVRVNIEVLNAQQQLFQTRRDLSRARYETLLASLRLKASTGQLSEQDLQQIDALLVTK
ncbi:MAG TPA: TolC family outer membrane protein [Burkholderiaceae bacterium]|nr:TolC family outer membrane protein [Burkholderiaceae bacterium]